MGYMSTHESSDEAFKTALGKALRMMKAKQGKLTDDIIEKRTGIPKATFGRYFRGERDVTMTRLNLLCKALGTTVGDVVALAQQLQDELESTNNNGNEA